ncbi:MAG: LuxR C-terminal-related transcriptional regulator [Paracoccaceae bacterium]
MSAHAPSSQTNRCKLALIVDDHPLFCDALSMTVRAATSVQDVQTATCLSDAMDKLDCNPDLILLDLNLPDVNGLEGLARLRAATCAPILVISSMADNRIVSSAIHAGAMGFVPKHSPRDTFRAAFDAIRDGQRFVPPGYVLLEKDIGSLQDGAERLASLTTQQARILRLICEGKLNKQIAYDLSIAETTVKAHVTAIMRKLGVQSRTQAVLLAKGAGF